MIQEFYFYLKQGIFHILDFEGFDHMLFLIVLCSGFHFSQYKKLIVLITAFTIGHLLTLVCTSLGFIPVNYQLVEILIPLTIIATAGFHLVFGERFNQTSSKVIYFMTLLFGLIHGMGFSNFFGSMMIGMQDSILFPLLSFNLGIEVGQIIIVVAILCLQFFFFYVNTKGSLQRWRMYTCLFGISLSVFILAELLLV